MTRDPDTIERHAICMAVAITTLFELAPSLPFEQRSNVAKDLAWGIVAEVGDESLAYIAATAVKSAIKYLRDQGELPALGELL